MWTDRRIALSELAGEFGLTVVRDGAFRFPGLLSTPLDGLLVPLFEEAALAGLEGDCRVTAVLARPELAGRVPPSMGVAVAEAPLDVLLDIHCALAGPDDCRWQGFDSRIAADARVHPSAVIAARDVEIGAGVVVGPNAVILERTLVGAGASIGPGAVLGSDGFEIRPHRGRPRLVPHAGGVLVGRDAVIQAGVTIDRALFGGFTEIGDEAALADRVHVAHAVRIGRRSRLAAGVAVGGSTSIGSGCWLGLNASVANGLTLGDGCFVTMGAVVTRDVPAGMRVTGNYAVEHGRFVAAWRRGT